MNKQFIRFKVYFNDNTSSYIYSESELKEIVKLYKSDIEKIEKYVNSITEINISEVLK